MDGRGGEKEAKNAELKVHTRSSLRIGALFYYFESLPFSLTTMDISNLLEVEVKEGKASELPNNGAIEAYASIPDFSLRGVCFFFHPVDLTSIHFILHFG